MKKLILIVTALIAVTAQAVTENQLLSLLKTEIIPFFQSGEKVLYEGVRGKKVHYQKIIRNNDVALVILPGRTEPTLKYAEVIYDLKDMPLDFFLWDPRGQGSSERLLPDPDKGYVEKWEDYTDDFKTFYQRELTQYSKVLILAHSMGGAIALRYSQLNPKDIHGFVLSAPMMEIKTDGVPEFAAQGLMGLFKLLGKKKEYVPGGGPFETPIPFAENRVTHSEPRFLMARTVDTYDPLFYMGAATKNWLYESIQMGKKIKKASERKKIAHIPILMFQAGKDLFSKDKRQQKFCEKHPRCELVRFELAKHEMFQETDSVRNVVMEKAMRFLEENL
jgi:lysophospholipase